MTEDNLIPKLAPHLFRYDNWDASGPLRFSEDPIDTNSFIHDIIGWCEASKVYCRPKNDDENIAIMFSDGTWCHLNFFYIFSYSDRYNHFNKFEGLDPSVVEKHIKNETKIWDDLLNNLDNSQE